MVTNNVVVVHAGEKPSVDAWTASLFLAGPNPRDAEVASWRPAALEFIQQNWTRSGILAVFVPEGRDWKPLKYDRHSWEECWLSVSDVICFWIPRDMQRLPGLNTNIEFGRWESSGRIVLGAPPGAAHVGYLRECAERHGAPTADTLQQTIDAALALIDDGAYRAMGHRDIPLLLWRAPKFASWLNEQHEQGIELQAARVLWVHDLVDGYPRYWALRAVLTDAAGQWHTRVVMVP